MQRELEELIKVVARAMALRRIAEWKKQQEGEKVTQREAAVEREAAVARQDVMGGGKKTSKPLGTGASLED
jgi:hypothetical protein